MNFNLGDYRCNENCFTYFIPSKDNNLNIAYESNKDKFKVYLIGGDTNFGEGGKFVISTYDFHKEKTSAIYLALSISILSGCIFLLFNYLREHYKERIK